jgi:hypothetical protein
MSSKQIRKINAITYSSNSFSCRELIILVLQVEVHSGIAVLTASDPV